MNHPAFSVFIKSIYAMFSGMNKHWRRYKVTWVLYKSINKNILLDFKLARGVFMGLAMYKLNSYSN